MSFKSRHVLFNACTVLFLLVCIRLSEGFWLWGESKVDGKWSEWSSYSSCHPPTKKEIYPYRQRTRQCNNPAPKHGGKTCDGKATRRGPCSNCDSPLGMENKIIKDSQITASTFHDEFPARQSRLNGPSAWCAKDLTGEIFLQVDFQSLTLITAIATQGYYPDPKELSLRLGSVSKYQITYSDDGINFEVYEDRQKNKVFKGNGKDLKTVLNTFDPQIAAKHIRIHPTAFIKFVCMKFELYGCRFKCGGYLPQAGRDLLAVSSDSEDVDCFWQAHLPSSQKINFDFINFNLPCKYGQVDIRGNAHVYGEAQTMGYYCDNKLAPPPIQSNSNKLWIRFRSNSSDHLIGFYGIYFPNCDKHLNSSEGAVNTPNYPKLYNHNTKCSWIITVPQGKRVMLKFMDFDIEETPGCKSDYLIVSGSNSSVIGQYCNSYKPPRLLCSNGNRLVLKFKSDDDLAMKGFMATYRAVNIDAPCLEPSSSIITPTPTISISISVNKTANVSLTSTIIQPTATATVMVNSTLVQNVSTGVLASGTGPQNPGMGKVPSKKEDDDDDEDTGLTTIIIISVFSFIVLCMIIASVVPSMIHGYEKRKREREWQAAADLALKKSNCVENEYEMQPIKTQERDKDEEPSERTAFLDPENPSVCEENCNFEPSLVHTSYTDKPDGVEIEDHGNQECELEYDTTDLNLNVSYEDLGLSFATEMAVLMNNYDYISPKKDPSESQTPQEPDEVLESTSRTMEMPSGEDAPNKESQMDDQSGNAASQPTTEEKDTESSKDKGAKFVKDDINSSPQETPTDNKNDKLQEALTDLKTTLLETNSDAGSLPDTNSTASVQGSQDIQDVPTVGVCPIWEKMDGNRNKCSNHDKTSSGQPDGSNTTNINSTEYSSANSHDQSTDPDYSCASSFGTETCV